MGTLQVDTLYEGHSITEERFNSKSFDFTNPFTSLGFSAIYAKHMASGNEFAFGSLLAKIDYDVYLLLALTCAILIVLYKLVTRELRARGVTDRYGP
jgi:hypothetical protein